VGDLIIFDWGLYGGGTTTFVATPSDNCGNSYTIVAQTASNWWQIGYAWARNTCAPVAGTGNTYSLAMAGGGQQFFGLKVWGIHGVIAMGNPVDQVSATLLTTETNPQISSSVTTTVANELAFSAVSCPSNNTLEYSAATPPWTIPPPNYLSNPGQPVSEYQILSGTATINGSFVSSGGCVLTGGRNVTINIVTFIPSASAPSNPNHSTIVKNERYHFSDPIMQALLFLFTWDHI
jgi:hypothetical protein